MKVVPWILVAFASAAFAEGPGSRIGTTPRVPLPPQPEQTPLTRKCDALRGEERSRCLREAREASPSTARPSGPGSTGMASGPGSGSAAAGTSGTGSFGTPPAR
jgi:hypothetical protein